MGGMTTKKVDLNLQRRVWTKTLYDQSKGLQRHLQIYSSNLFFIIILREVIDVLELRQDLGGRVPLS